MKIPGTKTFPAGESIFLQDHPAILEARPSKYNGCGNGFIVIDKATEKVVDMSYADDGVTIDRKQNLNMCDDAGRIIREDDKVLVVRANFSCWSACLF